LGNKLGILDRLGVLVGRNYFLNVYIYFLQDGGILG
jgi:hypothetical protein